MKLTIKYDLVVTRHQALINYLLINKLISKSTKIVDHINNPKQLQGLNVIGVLPHNYSCYCKTFTEVPLSIPRELRDRNRELTQEEFNSCVGTPITYSVTRIN